MYNSSMIKKILLVGLSVSVAALLYYHYQTGKKWDTVTMGSSLPLSGINKELGREILEGASSYFNHINQNGGIKGKALNYIYYDDKYEPQNTLRNTKLLIEKDQVFSLFGFVGTPTTKAILTTIDDMPFIAPYTGAAFLRKHSAGNIVNFRSSYEDEIENMIDYLSKTRKIQRFAIFYQNDEYGIEGYNATIKALNKRGMELVGEGTYKRNTLSIKHALNEIKNSDPEAIIIVGAYKPSARFIQSWKSSYKQGTIFAPISFVNANALVNELKNEAENIYFSLTVPSYDNAGLKVAAEYKKLLAKYYPSSKPSYASFESFLAAKAVIGALENIKGDITRRKFLKALKSLNSYDLGGIQIRYQGGQLLNRVFISTYKDGKFDTVKQDRP